MNNNTMPVVYGGNGNAYGETTAIRSNGALPVMRNFSMMALLGEWVAKFKTNSEGVPVLSTRTLRPRRRVINLDKWGKRRVVKRLGLIQGAQDKQGQAFELQGFNEVPFGFGIGITEAMGNISLPTRDTWGNLVNKLSEWGTTYLQTEKEKAEAKKLEAETLALQAAKEAKAAKAAVLPFGNMGLPIIAGLAILGFFMLRK